MEELLKEIERLKIENALLTRLLLEQGRGCGETQRREGILFVDFYQLWLNKKKSELQPSTFFEYNRVFENYIIPYFKPKQMRLVEMNSKDIEEYYCHLKSTYGMSNNTLIRHHANMHTCFKFAYDQNYLSSMVIDRIDRPQAEPPKIFNYYTIDELIELFKLAKDDNVFTAVLLAAVTGLSRSEALALKWDAINFNAGTITVMRKMTRDKVKHKDLVSRDLKTKARMRTLVLPSFLLNYFALLKMRTAHFNNLDYAEFVCVDEDGQMPTLNMITNRFRAFLQKHGLKKIRFHDLRHSCATLLNSLGYSMKDIQEWLGHSNYQTTANTYTHVNFGEKKKIAQKLNKVLGSTVPYPVSNEACSSSFTA